MGAGEAIGRDAAADAGPAVAVGETFGTDAVFGGDVPSGTREVFALGETLRLTTTLGVGAPLGGDEAIGRVAIAGLGAAFVAGKTFGIGGLPGVGTVGPLNGARSCRTELARSRKTDAIMESEFFVLFMRVLSPLSKSKLGHVLKALLLL